MEQILLSIFILIISIHLTYADKVCTSVDVKHEKDLEKLRDCTVVVGHVRFSNVRIFETGDIASSLEEITDYLIIYRVEGLETLEYILPNLTIIRGHKLLFDKYSLVVYENLNIRNLGLKSLLKIRRGSIKIESNPVLCFADTVNWIYLLEDQLQQHYSLKHNNDPNDCALCPKNISNSETEYLKTSCWNLNHAQRKKPIPHLTICPEECKLNGCTTDGKCCSPLCLTGCSVTNCRICKDFKNLQGDCVETCIVPYYTLADQCISANECHKRGLIPHAGSCISKCPKSYEYTLVNSLPQCNLLCNRSFIIRSKDDLDDVKDCVIIRGSLHIELNDDKSKIIEDLEKALGGIKEITGSLKITKSPQIVSLGFFKKLDTIKGDELIDREISFYVVNNYHLEEVWPENHRVAILKGRIFFHLNPRLCYEKILQLVPSIRNYDEIGVQDASPNSNGERVICGNKVRQLDPHVEDLNATAARIKLGTQPYYDKDVILGYLYYYKEAPVKNVTMFDGRHGCGHDNWQMDMSLGRNIRHVLSNLKPYTQYAFFVKTLTMVDYTNKIDWYSSIKYFTTNVTKPGPVQKMYSTPLPVNAIIVHWWPPKDVNGVIDKYLIRYELIDPHNNNTQIRGYISPPSINRVCDCGIQKGNRGPPPDDLNYYDRDQVIMEGAIPNLIYVSIETIKRLEEEQRLEDNTRRKRETPKSSQESGNNITTTNGAPKKIMSADEQNKIENEKAEELILNKHFENMERKSFLEQDTGIADFVIVPPKPICSMTNPSKSYQEKYNCTILQSYEGIEIPGNRHSYKIDNLVSNGIYKVFIRACVAGLKNACGPERSIKAETISKNVEFFLKGP